MRSTRVVSKISDDLYLLLNFVCIAKGLGQLTNLRQLKAFNFRDADMNEVVKLTQLIDLELIWPSHCCITYETFAYVSNMVTLERLSLSVEFASGLRLDPVAKLTKLKNIVLKGLHFRSSYDITPLYHLPSLLLDFGDGRIFTSRQHAAMVADYSIFADDYDLA